MNIYEEITNKIVESIKNGVVPWEKPWTVSCLDGECGAFFNLVSRKAYRGVNVWLLASLGHSSPFYVTYKQAKTLGGHVKQGVKGAKVVYWSSFEKEDANGDKKRIPFLKSFTVFNALEQCEGLEKYLPKLEAPTPDQAARALSEADDLVENMPKRPEIFHGGDSACYNPVEDIVRMPEPTKFNNLESYYKTLFHELVHSTGHSCRVGRRSSGFSPRGTNGYALEELIAELGATFLCRTLGIENVILENAAGYMAHWLEHLENDPKFFIVASGAAQKAVNFILRKDQSNVLSTDGSDKS